MSLEEANKVMAEASNVGRLQHPNILAYERVFLSDEAGKDCKLVYLVMRHCDAGDLDRVTATVCVLAYVCRRAII